MSTDTEKKKISTDFKYGDLIIKCHKCGGIQVVEKMVTDGRAIYIFNNNDSYIKLHCPDCDITMEMRMVASEDVDPELLDEELTEALDEDLRDPIANKEVESVEDLRDSEAVVFVEPTESEEPNEEFQKEINTKETV